MLVVQVSCILGKDPSGKENEQVKPPLFIPSLLAKPIFVNRRFRNPGGGEYEKFARKLK